MGFYFLRRFLSVLLLLVSLICATQGTSLRTRRSVLDNIGNTLNNIGETIKDTMKTKIDSLFNQYSTIKPETTEPTLEPDYGTSPIYRSIIKVPIKCPPDHEIVNGRCRLVWTE